MRTKSQLLRTLFTRNCARKAEILIVSQSSSQAHLDEIRSLLSDRISATHDIPTNMIRENTSINDSQSFTPLTRNRLLTTSAILAIPIR